MKKEYLPCNELEEIKIDNPLLNKRKTTVSDIIKSGKLPTKDMNKTYSAKVFNRSIFQVMLEEYSKDKYLTIDQVVKQNPDLMLPSVTILYNWIFSVGVSEPLIAEYAEMRRAKDMMVEGKMIEIVLDDSDDYLRNPDGTIREDENGKPIANSPAMKRKMKYLQLMEDRNKQLNPEHGKLRQQEIAQEAQIATVDVMAQALVRAAELKAGVNTQQEVNQDFIDHDKQ